MKQNGTLVALFAILVMTGGLIGYFVSNSNASLIASSIFGTLYLACSFALLNRRIWGQYGAIILSFFLAAFFGKRYFELSTTVPLVMTILSSLLAIRLLMTLKQATPPSTHSES